MSRSFSRGWGFSFGSVLVLFLMWVEVLVAREGKGGGGSLSNARFEIIQQIVGPLLSRLFLEPTILANISTSLCMAADIPVVIISCQTTL